MSQMKPEAPIARRRFKTVLGEMEARARRERLIWLHFVDRAPPLGARAPERRVGEFEERSWRWFDILEEEIGSYLAGRLKEFSIPIDLIGSELERDVWRATLKTRYGQRLSYNELAGLIGREGRARAVGSALAANRLIFLVPCHRIIRSDGVFGGYAGGLARKKFALDIERAASGEPIIDIDGAARQT